MLDEQLRRVDRQILGDVYTSEEGFVTLEELCDRFGSRFPGSPEEREAADFLLGKMIQYGLSDVHLEPVEYLAWERGTAELECLSPQAKTMECIALPHTGTCDLTGEFMSIGAGTPSEFAAYADRIKDRIVMCSARSPAYVRRELHRREKIGRAISLGAKAVIFMRDTGGFLEETGSTVTGRECPIPAISVSKEIGEELRRLQKHGPVVLRLRLDNRFMREVGHNVVGDIPGNTLRDEIILAGAHYDGHDISVGAMDNGSGTVMILEAARALAQSGAGLPRTLRFVCFFAEEIGLIGATGYVRLHPELHNKIRFMLNVDGVRGNQNGIALQGWPELIPFFSRIAADMKQPMTVDVAMARGSDVFPFVLSGIPSGGLSDMGEVRTERGFGHTRADTLDKVSNRTIQHNAAHIARLMLRLAVLDQIPAQRKSAEEIQALFAEANLLEAIRMSGRGVFEDTESL
ncbi:MAG: M20/M25/M40 family metallo-hydrolase [Bacillota bacterium]|nr:M20/M25/M40 family metallo-hydrolase [Bacillota bacterium]